jgi:hypothetical protein
VKMAYVLAGMLIAVFGFLCSIPSFSLGPFPLSNPLYLSIPLVLFSLPLAWVFYGVALLSLIYGLVKKGEK